MEPVIMEKKKCRKCGVGRLDTRTKRGFLVKVLLFWLPIKRYRCDTCFKKSYVLKSGSLPERQKSVPQVL
jgi:hypothetical protein